jgi:UDP-2,4-diacetamido-2,4,6-trideoxy-beta-L-altropyranose hydrolase
MKPTILFRVDGDARIGAGHVLRSLVLAEQFVAHGIQVEFVCRRLSAGLAAKVEAACFAVHRISEDANSEEDCRRLLQRATAQDAAWLALDGYEFSAEYRRAVYESGRQLLVVEDLCCDDFYHADMVVNSGLDAAQLAYHHPPGTILLLGPQYATVGADFAGARGVRDTPDHACKLLATFGGSDPADVSSRFLDSLAKIHRSDLEVRLIVGPANPRYEALLQQRDRLGIRCELVVDPPSMLQHMVWADLAIAAAGSTCWELATLGVPALLMVVAENQVRLAAGMERCGAACNLGWAHSISPTALAQAIESLLDDAARRQRMSQRGQELVDGLGVTRIHRAVADVTIQLTYVQSDDAQLLFDWVNDPQTRAMSFSSHSINWDEHCHWLQDRLRDPSKCVLWLARDAHGVALAQVRYDLHESKTAEAVVSISVAAEHRGRGVGRRLLQLSARRLFAERGIRRIHAFVRPENEASCRSLTAAGYAEMSATTLRNQPARHFLLSRE